MKALFHSIFLQRVCSCLLLLGLLFAFPLNVSAADDDSAAEVLDVREFTATVINGVEGAEGTEEVPFTYVDAMYGSDGCWMRKYTCTSDDIVKCLFVTDFLSLNSSHEYNLSFVYASDYNKTSALQVELLYFSSSGELIKSQIIDQVFGFQSGNNVYDADFKPDVSDIKTSYNIKLRISITTPNRAGVSWRISHDIKLIDKDDDSGWFQKILNKINDVWESIKALPDKIDASFQAVGDKISAAFESVAGDILDGIKEVLEWAFVPSDDFLNNLLDDWQTFFNDHFGVFAQASNFLIDMLQYFDDLFSNEYSFVFPEVSVPIMGNDIVIIEEQKVDMAQWLESGSFGARLYEIYTTCVWAIIIFCILKYALVVQDVFFAGYRMVFNSV